MIINSIVKPGPGKLISLRGREWMVLPSADEDVLMVRPLGGSDDEVTGIFLPLAAPEDRWEEAVFPEPDEDDINDFETARLLFDASRLSFRNVAGPFRCMGKLSFRPRSYQIVPLVMALRQPLTRLLIADDVGIGKTIEALIILKEMMERGEVSRFAVICQPHLCEQWQGELKDKLDIDAEIIRSSTVSGLERKLIGSESVFNQLPYQVVSIDYVKSDRRKPIFLNDCPEFIIVDEAHTCAMPRGASSVSQQQRYHLLHDIVKTRKPHLLMLTATPHSGKDEEFRSLLGLVNPEFESYDMNSLDQTRRRKIARHFIQRKRENIKRWLNEETPFPERETRELPYRLSADYLAFFHEAQAFARDLTRGAEKERGAKGKYWAALALLRGIMSSPAAGMEMLQSRIERKLGELSSRDLTPEQLFAERENPVIERIEEDSDTVPVELFSQAGLSQPETERLQALLGSLRELTLKGKDRKAGAATAVIREWLDQGFSPIIFCRFIATAKYLGEILRKQLPGSIEVQAITSELPDEQRREKIEIMGGFPIHITFMAHLINDHFISTPNRLIPTATESNLSHQISRPSPAFSPPG